MTSLPRLMVAPNGARHTRNDHPELPVTLAQTLRTAQDCFAAGADGLHMHLRKADGEHLLDAGLYREAVGEMRRILPDMAVQITTEAVGQYPAHTQRHIALSSGAQLVSIAVREMQAETDHTLTRSFYKACDAQEISVQHILYHPDDLPLLSTFLSRKQFNAPSLQLLFVIGRYGPNGAAGPKGLLPYLAQMQRLNLSPDWAACAFGKHETKCLLAAHAAGGKLRVGFENSFWNMDGTCARDNAERVLEIASKTDNQ